MNALVNDPAQYLSHPAAFSQLSDMLVVGQPVDTILLRVAQSVKDRIDAVVDVSVSIIDAAGFRTVVFTGALAIELDEVQYALKSGPCLDAASTERTVVVNTRSDTVYPTFSQAAYRQGVRHTLSIGLPTADRSAAGLNIYATSLEGFDHHTLTLARAFANYAAVAIGRAAGPADAVFQGQWQAALASRASVDRAVLTIVTEKACTREQALQQLLDTARSQGRRLLELASSVAHDYPPQQRPTPGVPPA